MIVRHLSISNFRGIRSLEWNILSPVKCLIGPGDSTKTTILDAIEIALLPYWNLQIDDSDFYGIDINNTIEIIVTVGNLPEDLLSDNKFGFYVRGWNPTNGINDEPQNDDELVLSIRFRIDESLEPEWMVINDRLDDKPITHRDREKLCVNRLGAFTEKQLTWSKGSTLAKLTEDLSSTNLAVLTANRTMRQATDFSKLDDLTKVTDIAVKSGKRFGIKPKDNFIPGIDTKANSTGLSSICLHDGCIPVRASGLGTRRLLTLSLQLDCSDHGSIILVDEIEYGLEPYRLRHLLRTIFSEAVSKKGQVLLTSHSSISTTELSVENLSVVRTKDGVTRCLDIPIDMQGTIRATPEALLAKKVLVCEGKTEYGLCLAIEKHWIKNGKNSFAYNGVALVIGEGDAGPKRTQQLNHLGYDVCFFIDSDKINQINPSKNELESLGILVLSWDDNVSIEERIAYDIPWSNLKEMIDCAIGIKGKKSILDAILSRLNLKATDVGDNPDNWLQIKTELEIRKAIGNSAKKKEWFKRIDYGEELGQIVVKALPLIPDKNLAVIISKIEDWVNG